MTRPSAQANPELDHPPRNTYHCPQSARTTGSLEVSRKPLVSVITPTYNRGETYLRETIDSVLAQRYPNFEYIILDDGSADNTCAVLESYDHPALRWERHENMGVIGTVNKGFSMAQGDYVSVVNSDDPVLLNWLEQAVAFMEANPDVLAGYPDWQMIDEHGQPIEHIRVHEYSRRDMIRWSYCLPGPGTLLRRHALELEPQYDSHYPQIFDFEYYLRLSKHGPLARIPETLATYRHHAETISTSNIGREMAEEQLHLVEVVFSDPPLPPEIEAIKNEAYSTAYYKAALKIHQHDRGLARRYFMRSLFFRPFRSYPNGKPRDPAIWKLLFRPTLHLKVRDKLKQLLGRMSAGTEETPAS